MLNRKSSFLVQILVRKKDCSIIFNTFFFFLMIRRPPRPPLFPNTTLFRPPGPPPNDPASADPQRIPDPGPTTALTRRPRSRLPSTPRVRPEHPTHTAQHRQSDAANNHRDPPDLGDDRGSGASGIRADQRAGRVRRRRHRRVIGI